MRSGIAKLLLALFSLTLCAVGAEIVLRAYYAQLWKGNISEVYRYSSNRSLFFELTPGWQGRYCDAEIQVNHLGMRDRHYTQQKPAGALRILGVGDSCTFGAGVAESETYLAQLENLLCEKYPGRAIEVLNTGVPGYNTFQEYHAIRDGIRRFDPDMIVIGFYVNDISAFNDMPVRVLPQMQPWRFPKEIWRESFFLQALWHQIDRLEDWYRHGSYNALNDHDDILRDKRENPLVEEHWRAYFESMDQMIVETSRRKIPLVILMIPDTKQMLGPEWTGMQRRIAAYAQEKKVPTIDALPLYQASDRAPFVSPDDPHPNPHGHRIIAQELLQAIDRMGVVR